MRDDTAFMITELRKMGLTTKNIAKQLGVPPSMISGYVHPKPGIPKITTERYYELRRFYRTMLKIMARKEQNMQDTGKTILEDMGVAESLMVFTEYIKLGVFRTMSMAEYVAQRNTKSVPPIGQMELDL